MAARTTRLLCLLLAALLLAGCGAASPTQDPTTAPESSGAAVDFPGAARTEQALSQINALGESPDDSFRTWYEIFVYSFRDSDGDGIGDLRGVMEGLDYLQELGVNGIWLMPVHPSTSYHKYNVSDYCAIDPDYGTMEDMEALLAACRERGIRVILDLVVNHTGSDHPWFREAVAYLQELGEGEPDTAACPYAEYYHSERRRHGAGNRGAVGLPEKAAAAQPRGGVGGAAVQRWLHVLSGRAHGVSRRPLLQRREGGAEPSGKLPGLSRAAAGRRSGGMGSVRIALQEV